MFLHLQNTTARLRYTGTQVESEVGGMRMRLILELCKAAGVGEEAANECKPDQNSAR